MIFALIVCDNLHPPTGLTTVRPDHIYVTDLRRTDWIKKKQTRALQYVHTPLILTPVAKRKPDKPSIGHKKQRLSTFLAHTAALGQTELHHFLDWLMETSLWRLKGQAYELCQHSFVCPGHIDLHMTLIKHVI